MKNLSLPQHINLFRLSEHGAKFHGSLFIKDMQRLHASLYNEGGEVVVDLTLGTDAEGTRFCHVQLQTEITLQCQRCMNPFTYGIISDFIHGITRSEEEADSLPAQYEPVIVRDGLLMVRDLVEDELILKLPIVPMHAVEECTVKLPLVDANWDKVQEKGHNPFHVLKLLKRERN